MLIDRPHWIAWDAVLHGLAQRYGWTPRHVGELTLGHVALYLGSGTQTQRIATMNYDQAMRFRASRRSPAARANGHGCRAAKDAASGPQSTKHTWRITPRARRLLRIGERIHREATWTISAATEQHRRAGWAVAQRAGGPTVSVPSAAFGDDDRRCWQRLDRLSERLECLLETMSATGGPLRREPSAFSVFED